MRALVCDVSLPRQIVSGLLGRLDKRFFFGPFSPADLRDVPDPALPADDWVVLRTRLCGICGSDYKQIFLNGSMDNPMTALISFPQVLGHEVVGTIERVGPAVRTRRVGRARRAESRGSRAGRAASRRRAPSARPASTRSAGTSRAA